MTGIVVQCHMVNLVWGPVLFSRTRLAKTISILVPCFSCQLQ